MKKPRYSIRKAVVVPVVLGIAAATTLVTVGIFTAFEDLPKRAAVAQPMAAPTPDRAQPYCPGVEGTCTATHAVTPQAKKAELPAAGDARPWDKNIKPALASPGQVAVAEVYDSPPELDRRLPPVPRDLPDPLAFEPVEFHPEGVFGERPPRPVTGL